jgi:hypothetical protein
MLGIDALHLSAIFFSRKSSTVHCANSQRFFLPSHHFAGGQSHTNPTIIIMQDQFGRVLRMTTREAHKCECYAVRRCSEF